MSKIIQETLALLKAGYSERFKDVTIEKMNAGIFMTVVKLSTGYSGISITNVDKSEGCHRSRNKYFGPFSPGQVHGQKVTDLFKQTEGNELLDVIKLAVMNAISSEIIEHSAYRIVEDKDPVELLDLSTPKKIVIVGAFHSYVKRFADSEHQLSVLELNEKALAPDYRRFYVPAADSTATMKHADIIIITGSTLANNTLDELLANIPSGAMVVVVGPTSSLIPDILFSKGVNIIGATRIQDAELAFTMVGEGAAGYHLFQRCAKKICLLNG
ncbi:MAG: DUF364 domain-containing protein [Bacteroidota bacterium]